MSSLDEVKDAMAEAFRNQARRMMEEAMLTGRAFSSTSTRVPVGSGDRGAGPAPSVTVEAKVRVSNCRTCWGTGKMWCYVGMKCPFCGGSGVVKA